MNRHERRASVRSMRGRDLVTHLIGSEVPLDDHGLLHWAVLHFFATMPERKPVCIGCKARFVPDERRVGAFLFAVPVGAPGTVVTSAFCRECHATLTAGEVDAICTTLLRQVSPGGRFLS